MGAVGEQHRVLVDVTLLQELEEDPLNRLLVVSCPCRRVEVHADAQPVQRFDEALMVFVDHLLGGAPLLRGPNGDRCAMLIAARDHQHAIATQPVVSGEAIGRQEGADHLPLVQGPVSVRPCDADEDSVSHRGTFLRQARLV